MQAGTRTTIARCILASSVAGLVTGCDGKPEDVETDAGASFPEGFASPQVCAGCHPTHYDQWRVSNPGEFEVRVRLLFRTFPAYLLRKLVELELLDPEVPKRVPLVEMESLSRSIQVP